MGQGNTKPVDPVEGSEKVGGGFYMMCRQHVNSSFYVYGLHANHPVLSTIKESIQSVLKDVRTSVKPEKHGEYVTKIELGGAWSSDGNIFLKGSTFNSSARGKIMLNVMIANLLNRHSYRPAFSTDLSRFNDRCTIYFEKISEPTELVGRAEVACLTLSGHDKIQLTCQKMHLQTLLSSLEVISREHIKKGWKIKEPSNFENDWSVAELDMNFDCWGAFSSSEGKMTGRLLASRLLFHFGRQHGWNFLFNGNIKDTADYMWFVRGDAGSSVIPNDFIPIAGFDIPLGVDAYAITLSQNDKLRLLNFPPEVHHIVQMAIQDFGWKIQRIEEKKHLDVCHEFKLDGYPWWTHGKKAVRSRMLIMEIFSRLLENGYRVRTALDVSRKVNDKSTIVFSRCNPVANFKKLILSPTDTDHLRMIGDIGKEERQIFEHSVNNIWPGGVKKFTDSDVDLKGPNGKDVTVLFADMHGEPWRSWFVNEMLNGRHLMLYLVTELKKLGWTLLCSADVSAKCHRSDKGDDYSLDCHAWFLIKQPADTPIFDPDQTYTPASPPSYFELYGF